MNMLVLLRITPPMTTTMATMKTNFITSLNRKRISGMNLAKNAPTLSIRTCYHEKIEGISTREGRTFKNAETQRRREGDSLDRSLPVAGGWQCDCRAGVPPATVARSSSFEVAVEIEAGAWERGEWREARRRFRGGRACCGSDGALPSSASPADHLSNYEEGAVAAPPRRRLWTGVGGSWASLCRGVDAESPSRV